MLVRITQHLSGSIDGIQLRRFRAGQVYDMALSLAHYLVASGLAVPAADAGPAPVVALDQPAAPKDARRSRKGSFASGIAADRPRKRRK